MGRAEDIVRRRLAQAPRPARQTADERLEQKLSEVAGEVRAALPEVMRLLGEQDYPDAELLNLRVPRRSRWGRGRAETEQMAAWLLDKRDTEDDHHVAYLLSDGTFLLSYSGGQGHTGGGGFSLAEILSQYSRKIALQILWGILDGPPGVRGLRRRYRLEGTGRGE